MADWSSLPSDLVARIADCLLATNDVDCYMDFRAVCANWRSSTDDPKNSSELRFRPRRWIIVDEVFQSDSRLLVNTLSGRVVRKDLPLLRRFYVVATTHGGFFVLAERKDPHAVCVLNPFTGHLIRFMAPLPSDLDELSAAVIGSSPSIILLSNSKSHRNSAFSQQHEADPDSECFICISDFYYHQDAYDIHMNRLAFLGGVHGDGERRPLTPIPVGVAATISALKTMFPRISIADGCFITEFAGQVFIIIKLNQMMIVFKLDTDSKELEHVNSIGNLAIFVGHRRCFTVNAEKFPSIGASCIYYVKSTYSHADIYKYDLKEDKEEMVSKAIDSLEVPSSSISGIYHPWHPVSQAASFSTTSPPFTLIQLLSSYTTNVRPYELEVEDSQYWSDRYNYEEVLAEYDIDCWE